MSLEAMNLPRPRCLDLDFTVTVLELPEPRSNIESTSTNATSMLSEDENALKCTLVNVTALTMWNIIDSNFFTITQIRCTCNTRSYDTLDKTLDDSQHISTGSPTGRFTSPIVKFSSDFSQTPRSRESDAVETGDVGIRSGRNRKDSGYVNISHRSVTALDSDPPAFEAVISIA